MFPQAEFRTIFLVPLSNYSQSECQLRVKICSLWSSFIGINKNDLSFLFASFVWVQGYNTSSSPHGSRQVCVKMMLSGFTSLRSKRFQSSYCAKVRAEAKFMFFCSCPSFLDEPREETLATQAKGLLQSFLVSFCFHRLLVCLWFFWRISFLYFGIQNALFVYNRVLTKTEALWTIVWITICNNDQFFSYFTEANIRESLQIKLYNPNFSASASKIKEMLANADLEGHGYKKKTSINFVKEPDKSGSTRQVVCYTAVFSVVTQRSSPLVGRSVVWRQ